MFQEAFQLKKEANLINELVEKSIDRGVVTEDIANGKKSYSTSEVGDWITNQI
jgi:3-isopropylmalate dehydrogenase